MNTRMRSKKVMELSYADNDAKLAYSIQSSKEKYKAHTGFYLMKAVFSILNIYSFVFFSKSFRIFIHRKYDFIFMFIVAGLIEKQSP